MPRVLVDLLQTTGTKGGIEVYVRELYRSIGTLGSNFEFVGFASRELMDMDVSWFPGEIHDSGRSGENRLDWALGELFSVSGAATRLAVDLIHGPAMFGPLSTRVPLVVTIHDLLYFSNPELMHNKLYTAPVKWMEKRGVANASRLITISEHSAAAIRKYLKYPSDRIDVIPLAARAASGTPSETAGRRHDVFIAMGQRSPYKDFETIVRAWALLPAESRPRLVITGGREDDPLQPLVSALGLGEWVELRGWIPVSELADLIATATAFIDSTLATGFSLPALEAMQSGLPVLLADTEVFREVGAGAADYFRPGDANDLARAVRSLAGDSDRRTELSQLGRARAATTSWTAVARATLDSFERAIQHPRRR